MHQDGGQNPLNEQLIKKLFLLVYTKFFKNILKMGVNCFLGYVYCLLIFKYGIYNHIAHKGK